MQELTDEQRREVIRRLNDVLSDDYNRSLSLEPEEYNRKENITRITVTVAGLIALRFLKEKENFTRDDVMVFLDNYDLDCIRFCPKCGKPFHEGYMTVDMEAYCSAECMDMTEKEIEEQYSDDEDCIFYTEWV